jgi:EAL domain-containing protein (putative c-di-GMP-specific phosphodiesterase class I)
MPDATAQAALDRALDRDDQLVLYYQPIHDARTGSVYAAEALLRQRRENGEIREASIIHEAAEDSCGPELFRLDSLLVRRAYSEAAGWPGPIRLNVNLSPREFQEGNVLERLTTLVTSCGIDVRRVNLEITETSYIKDPDEAVEALEALRKLGLEIWLDDFGTGHSTLTHLQKFPVDGLKIPGAFVRPAPADRRCRAIVQSLIALCHELDVPVIAEEVEHEEQRAFLLDAGCDYIQGFYFSKPVPPEEVQATFATFPSSGA